MVTILFVHFGDNLPDYLRLNISRTSKLFPGHRVVLVTDSQEVPNLDPSVVVLSPSKIAWPRSRPLLDRDSRFWGGWWQKTFDRLLLLKPVHSLYPHDPILHVESDTILFPSFPLDELRMSGKLAFPKCGSSTGVGSVVFSPIVQTTLYFESRLVEILTSNSHTTDMEALGIISNSSPHEYFELPEFLDFSDQIETINTGIFDGSSHGEWICGRDPKAHWGIGKRRQKTEHSRIRSMPMYHLENNQLFASFEGHVMPLHNLHVHSKEKYFFMPDLYDSFRDTLARVNKPNNHDIFFFDLGAFLFCLKSNLSIWFSSAQSSQAWKNMLLRILRKM